MKRDGCIWKARKDQEKLLKWKTDWGLKGYGNQGLNDN